MLVDTNFMIDLMLMEDRAIKKLNEIEERKKPWGVPSPVIFELWGGVARSEIPKKEQAKIMKAIGHQMILEMEEEAAKLGGIIEGTLKRRGEPIGNVDCMIAGMTIANNETLVTRNEKHFSKVKGLKLETY